MVTYSTNGWKVILGFWAAIMITFACVIYISKPAWAKSEDESKKLGKFVPNFIGIFLPFILPTLGFIFSFIWYANYAKDPIYAPLSTEMKPMSMGYY